MKKSTQPIKHLPSTLMEYRQNALSSMNIPQTSMKICTKPVKTLPCTSIDVTSTIDNSEEVSCNETTPKKRRFSEPRFVSEITSPDVKTPRRAKRAIQLAQATIRQKTKKIRALQESNRYLKKKIESLKDVIVHLRKNNVVSDDK
ncbi:unnamed protein product [Brassicogethes aeneus]|uniref:Uncharacterized protein n=1 Tax=Brassicogethes aeneus TaxID=1431903 RepID=A0A9P0ASL4_BRAAE|nr:unnamed protein product [Brassicogethes aeneus]